MSDCDVKLQELLRVYDALEERKALFLELDRLILELREAGVTEGSVGDRTVTIVDQYEAKNTAWTSAAVRRFNVKVEGRRAEPKAKAHDSEKRLK